MKKLIYVSSSLLCLTMLGCSTHPEKMYTNSEKTTIAENQEERVPSSDSQKLAKCVTRIQKNCSNLSGNNADRIEDNVESCKHVENANNRSDLEVMLLKDSGKVIVVRTRGEEVARGYCPMTKYNLDSNNGIREIKVEGNLVFLLSNDGQLYFMINERFYEILNSKHKSYSSITDIKGSSNGDSIVLTFANGQTDRLTKQELRDAIRNNRTRAIPFVYTTQSRSIFRDE